MYKHFLVPIDGSRLSDATVEHAVAFAKTCGARLSFFHAHPDYAATGDGALMLSAAPAAFADRAAGNARVILAKALVVAQAHRVPAESVTLSSDRPHEAILEAAQSQGCDLIVMASHGRRGLQGMTRASVTQRVLQRTTLPVLVAAVESNMPMDDEQRVVATVKDEHRSIAAVIRGLQHEVSEASSSARSPDLALLRAMLFYIDAFPERLHHPKEEAYLFAKLRQRTNECNALIDELTQEHRNGSALFSSLGAALKNIETTGDAGPFAVALEVFAQSQWQHMRNEEELLLRSASLHLTAEDWRGIAAAFDDKGDPRFEAEVEESFQTLFRHLMNLQANSDSIRPSN